MTTNGDDRIILIGGFGEVIELAEFCQKTIIGIVDNKLKGEYLRYQIFGDDNLAFELHEQYGDVPIVISPDSPRSRQGLARYYSQIGFRFCSLISPLAQVSSHAKIDIGSVVQTGANVSSMVRVGEFVKINVKANVMHDVEIGSYTTIAPNAVILGRVTISDSCYIGANSTILPNIRVGRNAVIGAGAVVTRDVGDGVTVIGNPARELKG